MQGSFRGMKHNTTHNVMAYVNFDLKFTYVLARWEGSAHDALVVADAIERDGGLSVHLQAFSPVEVYIRRPVSANRI